jgi:hypothetical protein
MILYINTRSSAYAYAKLKMDSLRVPNINIVSSSS